MDEPDYKSWKGDTVSVMNAAILIPAYNPTKALSEVVASLAAAGYPVVVVDDGSSEKCQNIFRTIDEMENVEVLHNSSNLGKGAALKRGLSHISASHSDISGVVTADADGQHVCSDIVSIAQALAENPNDLIIGERSFDRNVPLRSLAGNRITAALFRLIWRRRLRDTQSGLRGIPATLVPSLLEIEQDGYEFEMEMLLTAARERCELREIPISTVYIDNNSSSHFRPLADSARIYWVLLRSVLVSLGSAALDYSLFWLLYHLSSFILFSHVTSRIVSLILNYLAMRRFVFHSEGSHRRKFPLYLCLAAFSCGMAYLLILLLTGPCGVPVLAAKVVAELAVYFSNFIIQRYVIFRDGMDKKGPASARRHRTTRTASAD